MSEQAVIRAANRIAAELERRLAIAEAALRGIGTAKRTHNPLGKLCTWERVALTCKAQALEALKQMGEPTPEDQPKGNDDAS